MARIFSTLVIAVSSIATLGSAQKCVAGQSMCPGGIDGVSSSFLDCDTWTGTFVSHPCTAGQFCYANPHKPGTAMCSTPQSGGDPGAEKCSGNVAKCVASGSSGDYLQCDQWYGHFVKANCPAGLMCHDDPSRTGVSCY